VQSETVKHRQAVASVISSVAIAILYVVVSVDVLNALGLPIGSLVAPAAVLGAALGFGAQRIVQDLLSGFFIITEKQYGFGDLVQLTIAANNDAVGTVEDVTLRVTKLRMVARTLPGKQFDAGRRLRQLIVADLRREGISSNAAATVDVA
jgi:small-conductance mechanosensitive channel